ncbi:MAG: hypothetical protein L3K16_08270 [Thermoplasmata archaeon]|nr:hypothetical protein [Thermoplasmata archaeon]
MLAQIAAARKLSGEVWMILTYQVPYRDEDATLTEKKERRMQKIAEEPTPEVSVATLDSLADCLIHKADVLDHLEQEAGDSELGREVGNDR